MINKKDLKPGWYIGVGRNANIAYWTGTTFLTIGRKFDTYVIKDEGLYEEGWCFEPELRIAGTKVEKIVDMVEKYGEDCTS
jgi:hypothetical protein